MRPSGSRPEGNGRRHHRHEHRCPPPSLPPRQCRHAASGKAAQGHRDPRLSASPDRSHPRELASEEILIRADSHDACPEVLDWCEANGLDDVRGLAPTRTLRRHIGGLEASTLARFKASSSATKVRLFLHAGTYWLPWSLRALMPRRFSQRLAQFDTLWLRLVSVRGLFEW
jgi:hypothetical protein